jgi:hypothetical protein
MKKNTEKIILSKLEEIEDKVKYLSSRDLREKQYKLHLITMIGAAIVSLLIATLMRVLEVVFTSSMILIGVIILYFSSYVAVFLISSIKKYFSIDDFHISCKFNERNFKKLFLDIISNKFINLNNFREKKIKSQLRGLQTFAYIFQTFNENYDKKIRYLKKRINQVKELEWELSKDEKDDRKSSIVLLVDDGTVEFGLDSEHFPIKEAEKILGIVRKYEKDGLLSELKSEGF